MSEQLEQMIHDYKNGFPIDVDWLLGYAKEQAEQVEELEEDKSIMQLNLTKFVKDIKRLEKQKQHYYTSLKEANSIIFEAKESLNKGGKVNGLGYLYMAINQALEESE